MSASSTTSSTTGSTSQDENEAPATGSVNVVVVKNETDAELTNRQTVQNLAYRQCQQQQQVYANTSSSTLDRSQYQSLPFSGTRRVTVQFGKMKIVVPWKESVNATVRQLADAALIRFKRAKGIEINSTIINVIRMECASDGGILDMEDVLEDVFDLNYDQIVAITDENPMIRQHNHNHHYAQPFPISRHGPSTSSSPAAAAYGSVSVNASASPYNVGYAQPTTSSHKSRRDSVVEVKSFENAPSPGLKVTTTPGSAHRNSFRHSEDSTDESSHMPILRSSIRTADVDQTTPTSVSRHPRVTLSPEVEKRLTEREQEERKSQSRPHYEKNPGRLNRGSDRKSRINDAFMDARERLAEKIEHKQNEIGSSNISKRSSSRGQILEGSIAGTTVVIFSSADAEKLENSEKDMGIEVNAVYDDVSNDSTTPTSSSNSKLSAIQVMKIEKNGRIGRDGRIKVGDSILEIDGRPVYQMSILRARAYIADLAVSQKEFTLTIARPVESFFEQDVDDNANSKPIFSALQQANTQYIGHTTIVELVKSSNGFGFTVTGRETAKGERLFYIGTVKPYGVALGLLKSGDRLLEIDGESTGDLTQAQIVDKLKVTMVGAKVKFLVSRVSPQNASTSDDKENDETQKKVEKPAVEKLLSPTLPANSPTGPEKFELIIPLNDTGSAGLGVSLKARVSVKSDGSRHDCGIFIKNVMHGGAAFKDKRLQVNDRIIGIEELDLEMMKNSAASEALTKKLKAIGPSSSHVRLVVIRDNDHNRAGPISRDSSRITVDAPSPAPSSRISSNTAPGSLLPSPHTGLTSSSGADSNHSRQSSSSSHFPAKKIESDTPKKLDDTYFQDASDPFDREAPGRKSLSEKRGLGAAADPQHIKLFQDIKHQRQNSAPPSSTSRSEKRSKSQPRSKSQRNYRSPSKAGDVPAATTLLSSRLPDDEGMLSRRSLSMESINRPVGSVLRGTGIVTDLTEPTTKRPVVQFSKDSHPFPPGSPLMRVKNDDSRSRDKSRRKSVGNAMRSFFGFGNKSREVSPEKAEKTPDDKIRENEFLEKRRGSGDGGMNVSASGGGVYVDYGEPYGMIPQYPPQTSGYESYADSELYDRYAAHRYQQNRAYEEEERDYYYDRQRAKEPPYVNYGLPTSHSYHVESRLPPPINGGSVSSASLRRAYNFNDPSDGVYQQQQQQQQQQHHVSQNRYRNSNRGDYYHMFNSWFAYTGGGAAGAAPILKSSYGSPVRIAAASAIERGESIGIEPNGEKRGRSTSSGAIGTGSRSKDEYADVRSGKLFNGGSTRMFIPRHGGGISAATFATGFEQNPAGGASSPSQFRRRDIGGVPSNRFPQY